MSSMIPSPPQSIKLGGGAPAGPGASGGSDYGPGGDGPDSEQVKSLVSAAITNLRKAEDLEGDPGDQSLIAKCVADLRKFIGAQQADLDSIMGGGPGAKIMRKNTPPAGA